jgi:hypothetical protein
MQRRRYRSRLCLGWEISGCSDGTECCAQMQLRQKLSRACLASVSRG